MSTTFDEDALMKRRASVDERFIRKLTKDILPVLTNQPIGDDVNSYHEQLKTDLENVAFQAKKITLQKEIVESDIERTLSERNSLANETLNLQKMLQDAKAELAFAQTEDERFQKYDLIVDEIMKYSSKECMEIKIQQINEEIAKLASQRDFYDSLSQTRSDELNSIINLISELKLKGMVKSYLKYDEGKSFGLISSSNSNISYDESCKLLMSGCLEKVQVWNIKQNSLIESWFDPDEKGEVTVIRRNPVVADEYAVGYSSGSIKIWKLGSPYSYKMTFQGHRSAISALEFEPTNGTLLASGSKDTDIVIWDTIAESGVCRLKGHSDAITDLKFIPSSSLASTTDSPFLLSASKDTFLKVWELATRHCMDTILNHRCEIYALEVVLASNISNSNNEPFHCLVFTASADAFVRVFQVKDTELNQNSPKLLNFIGKVNRCSNERSVALKKFKTSLGTTCLALQSNDSSLEIYALRSESEVAKKLRKRKIKSQPSDSEPSQKEESQSENVLEIRVRSVRVVHASKRIRSFDVSKENQQFLIGLNNYNSIEMYSLSPNFKEWNKVICLESHGHRTAARSASISHGDDMICSASGELLKVWNARNGALIRSISCGNANVSLWIPGDQYVILGTKDGELELFDLNSGELYETIKAHSGPITSLILRPDKKGILTGSQDKNVKFWDFEWNHVSEQNSSSKRLTVNPMRTLKMSDSITSCAYSADQRLVAIALLDSTIKVFFHDTLKFFLSLYGHKLPVAAIDISFDSRLLISVSADKNIKIWGLDFGDCHKSIFGHEDVITCVKFIPNTHYFFTGSKDKSIKYWDAGKFELITKMEGHHSEVLSLSISKHGHFLVSSSQDQSIRIWNRTEEQVFVEEERDREMEEMLDKSLTLDDGNELPSKKTTATLKFSEQILEALEIAEEDRERSPDEPVANTVLIAYGGISGDVYLMNKLEKIPSAELEEVLLQLPFTSAIKLLNYFKTWIEIGLVKKNHTMICNSLFFLLKIHQSQISSSQAGRVQLESIRTQIREKLSQFEKMVGMNLSALKYLQQQKSNDNYSILN